jgi:hypothetical protein
MPGQHGWVWKRTSGKYDLSANVQGGTNEGSASAVSAAGVVVLTSRASTCMHATECWRTSLWTDATGFKALGTPDNDAEAEVTGFSLNDAGTVVGSVTRLGKGTAPYRWDSSTGFKVLPNQSSSSYGYATAINSSGAVVGASLDESTGSIVATAWPSAGGILKLSPSDVNASIAVAISNAGTIAGWAAVSTGVNHAVIWKASTQAARTNLSTAGVANACFSTASTSCLTNARSIVSRGALFSCVAKADLNR